MATPDAPSVVRTAFVRWQTVLDMLRRGRTAPRLPSGSPPAQRAHVTPTPAPALPERAPSTLEPAPVEADETRG